MSSYDNIISIKNFAGINQSTHGHNLSLNYAMRGINFDTTRGVLKPFHKAKLIPSVVSEGVTPTVDTSLQLADTDGDGALTLAFLIKRWQSNSGVIGRADTANNTYAIAVVDGKLYYRKINAGSAWTEILNPADSHSFAFSTSKFDTVTYEMNYTPPVNLTSAMISAIYAGTAVYYYFDTETWEFCEVHSDDGTSAYYTDSVAQETHTLTTASKVRQSYEDAPVDCLLMTNSKDGLWCVYAPLEGDTLSVVQVPVSPGGTTANIKFGALARYAERIFGAAIETDPDKIMYCAPYDFFNWEQYDASPDDGAGDIQQPNWDGDQFMAIKPFGASLLAIKKHAIWRITGTTPSEFVMRKQYGEGTIAEDSVAINGAYTFMLTDDDIKIYDGSSTSHLKYGCIRDELDDMASTGSVNIGRFVQDRYVLQIASKTYGQMFVIYNTAEGTFNLCQSEGATALETCEEKLYGLYPAKSGSHYYVQFGEFLPDTGAQHPVTWESTRLDCSSPTKAKNVVKNVVKSGFIVYIMFDCNDAQYSAGDTITFSASIITEKKSKTKQVMIPYNKVKRIRLNNHGRELRLKLQIPAQELEWMIANTVNIYLEYDFD